MENKFKILGFTCGSCAMLAQRRIEKIEGVTEAKIGLDGQAIILSDRKVSAEEIKVVLKDTPYTVLE